MVDNRAIGVFDSGLGGLTVVKELINRLPNENIVYFGDTGRVPYGTRSHEIIKKYACEDQAFLLSKNVKLIVAACGTVSSVASDTAKDLPVSYFEVVTHASSAAVKATKNKKIGVIGTPATVNSGKHKEIINNLMPEAEVLAVGCPLFVPLVEAGWTDPNDIVVIETVKRYLKPILEFGADTLILGCTHYPLLTDAINKVTNGSLTLINAGTPVADAVAQFLEDNNIKNSGENEPLINFYVSDKPNSFVKTASQLLGEAIDINKIEQVNLEDL